jgi:arsenite methyltransferase
MSIPTDQNALRDVIRERYAAAATVTTGEDASASGCCQARGALVTDEQRAVFGSSLYDSGEREELPEPAVLASLGCGNPIAGAELHEGETVLDLGSGGGIDVLLSARRVGPAGMAYGLDMTDEMLDLARRNQAESGIANVQWMRGHIEDIPLPRDSVDVIISNCVINLSGDKPRVLREAARVLAPGGRFAVSDVIANDDMDHATRADMQAYTGCIAGALTRGEFTEALEAAGFTGISITETHRVHPAAVSAVIRATKPAGWAPPAR